MTSIGRQMRLGAFLRPAGHHVAAWRHPSADADAGLDFSRFIRLAQIAERGLFDMLFLADTAGVPIEDMERASRTTYVAWVEPFTAMVALARSTRHIGLICTASTTFDEPYNIARRFASLDIVSGGRGGWNLITSSNPLEWMNYNEDRLAPREKRYARAREFAQVVRGLYDSWDDDAFVIDRASGRFFDPKKVHVLNHKGEFFRVRGPLNVARSPQGQPVLVQAGASEDGKNLAAETADVVFAATPTIDGAREFYADVKRRVEGFGRDPNHIVIMPGFQVTLGHSDLEAQEKFQALQDLIPPEVGMQHLSQYIGFDLTGHPIDGPLPEIPLTNVNFSRTELLVKLARRENLTIRQLYQRISGGRGHFQTYGTPRQVADTLEEWFTTGAADGFNVLGSVYPGDLTDFVDMVIPELQRRGLFRTRYEGKTLRDNLGLPFRASQYRTTEPIPAP